MNPHRLTWGPALHFPFAQLIAIFTISGVIFTFFRAILSGQRVFNSFIKEIYLLLLLWILFTLSTIFALHQAPAWHEWIKVTKIFLITFLTILVITDYTKLRYLCLIIAFSLGFYGIKGGIFSVLSGGQYIVWGPDFSFIAGNNGLGLALNMTLPMFFYIAKAENNIWLKRIFSITIVLSTISVIFTYSRGAFLGLCAVFFLILFKSNAKKKIIYIILIVLLVPTVFMFVPEKLIDRIETIQTYEQDQSAMSRINAWTVAWKIALDHPLFGAGFEIMEDESVYDRYFPSSPTRNDVHSVVFEILSENGFVTFFVFIALFIVSFVNMRKIRRIFKHNESNQWVIYYSHFIDVGLIAFLITGLFLELSTFDLLYHFFAISIVIKIISKKLLQENNSLVTAN